MGIKHVLIVFGETHVKGALLRISSTLSNTVCSSSKCLQKKQVISKDREGDLDVCIYRFF